MTSNLKHCIITPKFALRKKYVHHHDGRWSLIGGFGEDVSVFTQQQSNSEKMIYLGISYAFIEHGSPDELYELVDLSAAKIAKMIKENLWIKWNAPKVLSPCCVG